MIHVSIDSNEAMRPRADAIRKAQNSNLIRAQEIERLRAMLEGNL